MISPSHAMIIPWASVRSSASTPQRGAAAGPHAARAAQDAGHVEHGAVHGVTR